MKRRKRKNKGLSLVELMVATAVFILAFIGILISFVRCLELSELAKNSSIALNATESRMEQLKNETFANIFTNYDQATFTTPGLDGIGVSYVDNSNPDLLEVTITFCWRQSRGRVIGEDQDLDGVIDGGEDVNGNNILDSYVQIVTHVYDI